MVGELPFYFRESIPIFCWIKLLNIWRLHLHLLHEAFLKGQDLHVRQLTFQARGVQKMVEALSGLGDRMADRWNEDG